MASVFRSAFSARVARPQTSRAFSVNTVARKDLVQAIYVQELKGYKAPIAKDAHVGNVKEFSAPSSPTPPSLPTDLASELAAYEQSEPTIAEVTQASATPADAESGAGGADAFLAYLEADIPKAEAHH
ncbi:hypothetical protein BOTBODRAFT_223317 [Botryobasidium botryosum FD-172 SS1]|uniref:ATP synthase complex subunit H n=1 Tax=Botryobasidium botryosum (strain FD-172 SS1) TaxID=930990 RepID=A0A067MMM9_BOTB1|nr:hypothetical protein BOTBODRAFT_223317 [Botryobasidium botryosum FD-172 SS1]